MEDGARRHQAAHQAQYELVATGIKDEQDVSRQIGLVEQMIARRVQAIVLAPADSKALVGVTRRAVDAGIVVVNIDNRLDRDAMAERQLTVPFVGPDNRAGALAVGRARRLAPQGRRPDCHPRRRAQRVQRHRAHARISGRGARGRPGDRPIADRQLGNGASQPGRLGAGDRAARREGHPVRQRQHGAWRRRRAESRRSSGHGARGRLRQHLGRSRAAEVWRDRRHRRSARRPARGLRHRVRAAAARRRLARPCRIVQTRVDLITDDRVQ